MAGFPKAGDEYGGRYRIVREIGHGGMGIVYEAVDSVLNRSVALKIVLPSLPDRDDYQARFAREASVLARIRSRHIVGIHEYGEYEDTVYFVTELFPDGDLQRWLVDHGPLDRRSSLLLVAQVCEALADAHASGVVHRDVKPGNVLLWHRSEGLIPYLADFGIAIDGQQGLTRTGALVGSPAYMAPERHFGHAADERGDVYSVGCLLWAVLTGDAPYSGTDFQMMNSHINEPTPALGTGHPVDRRIDEVLGQTMHKDPERRLTSAEEVRQALLAIVREVDAQVTGAAPAPAPMTELPPLPTGVTTGEDDGGTRMVPRAVPVPEPVEEPDAPAADREEPEPVEPEEIPVATDPEPVAAPAAHVTTIRDTPVAPPPVTPPPADEDEEPRRRRGLWLAAAAAVVLLVGGIATAVAVSDPEPASPPVAQETTPVEADVSTATEETLPPATPEPPTVTSSSGYRSVSFRPEAPRYRGEAKLRVEYDAGDGWETAGPRIALDTPMGGVERCVRFRSVATDEAAVEAASTPVRSCGKAQPATVEFIRSDDPCVNSIGGPCTWYDVAVTGFRSNVSPLVNVRRANGLPWCEGCDYDRIEVGGDGRGYLKHDWKISRDEGQVILDVAGVTAEFRVYY